MTQAKQVPLWAKLPIEWIQADELRKFKSTTVKQQAVEEGPLRRARRRLEVPDRAERNRSIAALKLYIAICIRTDFHTGQAKTSYDELITLTGMSRPVIARTLKQLEELGRITRTEQSLRSGTLIYVCGWLEDRFSGQLPKRWLYDGNQGRSLLKLREFKFDWASFYALMVYLTILAFRDKHRFGLTIITYDRINQSTNIGRHRVADAITMLYQMELISFRPGSFDDNDHARINRYLVRGLNIPWTALNQAYPDYKVSKKKSSSKPSKTELAVTKAFMQKS
ncbi:MarR family transcriptional regulator [Pseudomonas sp. KB_15]|uniref:MarR family transcriptional regulator n=1 Tax=Pseudomonas sp. KB_15 TaxID=3233035 RepID=UPI003F975888